MYISRITKDNKEQYTAQHLRDCSEHAFAVGQKFNMPNLCKLTALYHDIGKFTEVFVDYLRRSHAEDLLGLKSTERGSVIHAIQGAKKLYEAGLAKASNDKLSLSAFVGEIAAVCIYGHHGRLLDGISPEGETALRNRLEKKDDCLDYIEALRVAEAEGFFLKETDELFTDCERELKLFFERCAVHNLNTAYMLHLLVKDVYSCLVDSDRYNAYCFETEKTPTLSPQVPLWEELARRLELKLSTFVSSPGINEMRKTISDHCLRASNRPLGIYQLDVSTGGGKTLASLRFALNHADLHGAERIIYVVPYLSVLEQTAKDIRDCLQCGPDDSTILEHHSNFSIPTGEGEPQAYKLLTDRWDSPIVITTMVQFLESIYSHKSGDLRKFHNMSRAIFVFDEVQSLPLKCTYLFNEAINYLHYIAGSSILLCTATQPPLERVGELSGIKKDGANNINDRSIHLAPESKLIPDMSDDFRRLKRTSVSNCVIPIGYTVPALQEFVLDKYEKEKSCLVILNTKADAEALYSAIAEHLTINPDDEISLMHLSTSMCPAHRLDVIKAIKDKKQKNVLCISTQLIEAGVDVSFNCVIRAVAGLDSIAQAAGRCNRNGEHPNGKTVYIVNIANENLTMLPDIKIGADVTLGILGSKKFDDLLSPEAITEYYTKYYHRRASQLAYPINSFETEKNLYLLLSSNPQGCGAYRNQNTLPMPALRQAYQSAGELFSVIRQETVSVLVPYKRGQTLGNEYCGAQLENKKALLREIGRFSVSLFPYQIEKLKNLGALTVLDKEILLLDEKFYNNNYGIVY